MPLKSLAYNINWFAVRIIAKKFYFEPHPKITK